MKRKVEGRRGRAGRRKRCSDTIEKYGNKRTTYRRQSKQNSVAAKCGINYCVKD